MNVIVIDRARIIIGRSAYLESRTRDVMKKHCTHRHSHICKCFVRVRVRE